MKKKVLVPSIRNLKILPPVISLVNCLADGLADVTVYSYQLDKESYASSVKLVSISEEPYPQSFLKRVVAKATVFISFYIFLIKNAKVFDIIWIGVWDYPMINTLSRLFGFKGKIVYQFHELEPNKYKFCSRADFCVIPEENRLWITYFEGSLKRKPLLLPNIPFLNYELSNEVPAEIADIKNQNRRIVLYQGLIDFKKRCINELLAAFTYLPDSICLVIMPMPNTSVDVLNALKLKIKDLKIDNKVSILKSQTPPFHLNFIKHADVGIGLYRPTSLNQIYAAPNRLYEFAKYGVPIILPDFPSFNALSYKYPFAINAVDPESSELIAKHIVEICNEDNFMIGRKNMERFFVENGDYKSYVTNIWNKIELEPC
jgi:hypothetical protein